MNLLVVCTANRVRSPMAESLIRHDAPDHLTVTSAGTHARAGEPITPAALEALQRLGVDGPEGFGSRPLTRPLINSADLILTMESAHRAGVVTADPGALRRTFTLREFARLVGGEPAEGDLVEAAAARRGMVAPPPPGDDDIADPMGYGAPEHDSCLTQIRAALTPLTRGVFATSARPR